MDKVLNSQLSGTGFKISSKTVVLNAVAVLRGTPGVPHAAQNIPNFMQFLENFANHMLAPHGGLDLPPTGILDPPLKRTIGFKVKKKGFSALENPVNE